MRSVPVLLSYRIVGNQVIPVGMHNSYERALSTHMEVWPALLSHFSRALTLSTAGIQHVLVSLCGRQCQAWVYILPQLGNCV